MLVFVDMTLDSDFLLMHLEELLFFQSFKKPNDQHIVQIHFFSQAQIQQLLNLRMFELFIE